MKILSKHFNYLGCSTLLLGLLLTACQISSQENSSPTAASTAPSPETVSQTAASSETVAQANQSPETIVQNDSPEAIVQTLYHNFSSGNTSIVDQDQETLSRYFNTEMVNLILQDRACAERTQGICNLDFDILHNTQDPQISDLQIGTFDSTERTVTVTFKNDSRPETIIYQMENTSRGWRIADIQYPGEESLKTLLSKQ